MNKDDELDAATTRRVRAQLDQGAEQLNVYTVQRLARARAAAVNGERAPRAARSRWLPALGAAVAAALVVAVTLQIIRAPDTVIADAAAFDLELLTSHDDLELYQDLEFYAWLDDENENS